MAKKHKKMFAGTVVSQIRTTEIDEKLRSGKWISDSAEKSFIMNAASING